ncbi:hypothetical protein [Persicitalea jodogahamensis]|uniref:Uncharacterized protein n=1 Tax=Persicitalea jodogahamensis TaxID=402147 RepID=A0A8J3D561_9BACT|nr:hypothetical protein [Persicitalea jodogahamensis]GHB75603.1 hypothetical protein GCM10007390_31710 [Persicitalea jodogahamensis]
MTPSEEPSPGSISSADREKLRELTAQSWEMELAISGVAIFAVLQLPDLLDQGFDYLRFNLITQTEGLPGLLPLLALSMTKSACYVLFLAFLVNFVMRAYWVGLVGLLAVYPSGIRYDRIPFISTFAQEQMEKDLGPLDRYIVRLDRRCNIVFATAFLLVLMIFLIASAYVQALVVYLLLRPALPVEVWQMLKIAVYAIVALYFVASVVLSLKQARQHPVGIKLQYGVLRFNQLLMLGVHKPISYIINTFYSNISTKYILRTIVVVMVVFMGSFFVEFTADLSRTDRRIQGLASRHLYTARIDEQYVNPLAYDNLRDENDYLAQASIQADVIQEPYIRLFIAYPKTLDTLLKVAAKEPIMDDSLSRQDRRQRYADWSSEVLTRILHVTVNDSLFAQPEVLFTQRGVHNQRGWQMVLIPNNLRIGKNLLRVGLKTEGRSEPDELIAIPFWYVPN